MKKVDQVTFEEILAAFNDGMKSIQIANEFDLTIDQVNKILDFKDYHEYNSSWGEKVLPLERGHLRSIVAKKYQENDALNEVQDTLQENIKALSKILKMLESRKEYLESSIKFMERYISEGILIVERHVEK